MGRVPWGVKWVLGPAAAVAVGFYGVAPRVRGKLPVPRLVEQAAGLIAPKEKAGPPPVPKTAAPDRVSAPSVKVAVRPVDEEPPKPPRRRRRRRPRAVEEARPPERTGPDPASTPE